MTAFDPTRPPAGRLARLGIVLDTREAAYDAVAVMAERAGIDVVWVIEATVDGAPVLAPDPWAAAARAAARLGRARVGVHVAPTRDPDDVARRAAELASIAVVGSEVSVIDRAGAGVAVVTAARATGPVGRLGVVVEDVTAVGPALVVADDVVLPAWRFSDLEGAADEARAMAAVSGRDPATLGVATVLPVSIGRTHTEASVRADADPLFRVIGHPGDVGIYGTLEECQDRVIALAHAGITDLRCILPTSPDVLDVIAQLTAMTIGTTEVLMPGSLRSPAPPPPEGWGGRPDMPPQQQVSGGSRRR